MDDASTIGTRLRVLRRWRGMTLEQLGGQAGLTGAFLSMVERGQRALDRRSHVAAVASALRVSEVDLVGGAHLSADPVQSGPHAGIPALRVALETNSLLDPSCERARDLPTLVSETEAIRRLFMDCDYVELWHRLPPVIDELHLHVAERASERDQQVALRTLIEACNYATFRSKDLGYPDLSHIAASRATEAAAMLGEPTHQGKAAYMRSQTMPREGSWDRALTVAERAVGALQPHVNEDDPLSVQVCGMLSLNAALAAAALYKTDTAADWLREAQALAARTPDEPRRNWSSFSSTNVAVWSVAIAVERGETGTAVLEKAEDVSHRKLNVSRRSAFMADVGRGLARERKTRNDAVLWLRRAEEIAPQRIRNNTPVRHTVEVLMSQAIAEAGGRELRGMASRMGILH